MARPTIYTDELALDICEQIAQGKSLRSICEADEMPAFRTVMYWCNSNSEFLHQYTRAKDIQADYYADELISIADDFDKDADDPTAVSRAKLQIDTRKWVASKLKPKSYGDKLTQDINVREKKISDLTNEELEEELANYGYTEQEISGFTHRKKG